MTTIENGNLKCLLCGAVHIVNRPIASQRLMELSDAFKVLHDDCRGRNSLAYAAEVTIKDALKTNQQPNQIK